MFEPDAPLFTVTSTLYQGGEPQPRFLIHADDRGAVSARAPLPDELGWEPQDDWIPSGYSQF